MKEEKRYAYFVRNMTCRCCEHLVNLVLQLHGYEVIEIQSPKIVLYKSNFDEKELEDLLSKYGMSLIKNKDAQCVEMIKQAVTELIHYSNNIDSIVRKSEYLVERLRMPYQKISRIFSKHEGITLERYMMHQKMERVKELLIQNEYTLSEIAYLMDFSSVHHLSSAFKKYCGITVSEFKQRYTYPLP